MDIDDLEGTGRKLAELLNRIASTFPTPLSVRWGPSTVLRHSDQTNVLAAVLKCVKLVSTLNGALVLLRHGYVQEIGALCRIADDCCTDIMLLCTPQQDDSPSDEKVRFLDDFYREEADDPEHFLTRHPRRDNVPRRKLNAAVARALGDIVNPSDAQAIVGVPQRLLSGYIHGAYPHIMELYGGPERQFHMTGMLGTPRITEGQGQVVTYVYRALTLSAFVAHGLSLDEVHDEIMLLRGAFEDRFGCKPSTGVDEHLRRIKN